MLDWEVIEREYRAGQLSIRELARQHGCTDGAIRKRAKAEGWQRNLASEVRKRVREKLVRTHVRTCRDADIIEEVAERGAQAVTLMRADIARLRELEQTLIAELVDKNKPPQKTWVGQFQGAVVTQTMELTVSERSAAAANLAQVVHKRIALERQALNLDDDEAGAEIAEKILAKLPADYARAVRRHITGRATSEGD